VLIFNNLFYSVDLRHVFVSKFLPVIGCIEKLDIAFILANAYQIVPLKDDSTREAG